MLCGILFRPLYRAASACSETRLAKVQESGHDKAAWINAAMVGVYRVLSSVRQKVRSGGGLKWLITAMQRVALFGFLPKCLCVSDTGLRYQKR